jgi:tetratricopeptide (TPR) repeat protein
MIRFCTTILLAAGVALAGTAPGGAFNKRPVAKKQSAAAQIKKCKAGEVFNKRKKKCVQMESRILPDGELLAQGVVLARAGDYDWAISVLSGLENQFDPEALTMIGYSHRHAGRLETGIGFYNRALAVDPNYVQAREYLGEGLVQAGKFELAAAQLREIEIRCGRSCAEYQELAEALAEM